MTRPLLIHRGPRYQRGFGFGYGVRNIGTFGSYPYRGPQSGEGLGSIFTGLARYIFPTIVKAGKAFLSKGGTTTAKTILKKAAKEAGKKTLKTAGKIAAESAGNIASSLISGENAKEAFKKEALKVKEKLDSNLSNLKPNEEEKKESTTTTTTPPSKKRKKRAKFKPLSIKKARLDTWK